jgi:23S rRNA (guanosine2251-2'-O)-methyltransferase
MSKTGNFYVYGRNSVVEIVTNKAKTVNKIFVKNSIPPNSYSNLITSTKENLIPLVTVPEKKLEKIVGRVNHQGFVAQITNLEYLDFYSWIEEINLASYPGVLLLDGIEDPHNFGAILRTAAAAGMAAVIVPSQHQAPLNATVFKTSSGTAGRIPIIRVQNTVQGFKDLKLAGFKVYALSSDSDKAIWELQVNEPTAFVIGNEGRGISNKLMKMVDYTLMLPMENNVESLNASVTAALVCYEWKKKITYK